MEFELKEEEMEFLDPELEGSLDTDPETEVTDPETEVTDPETEVTDPETEVTDPEIEVTDPETENIPEMCQPDVIFGDTTCFEDIPKKIYKVNRHFSKGTIFQFIFVGPLEYYTKANKNLDLQALRDTFTNIEDAYVQLTKDIFNLAQTIGLPVDIIYNYLTKSNFVTQIDIQQIKKKKKNLKIIQKSLESVQNLIDKNLELIWNVFGSTYNYFKEETAEALGLDEKKNKKNRYYPKQYIFDFIERTDTIQTIKNKITVYLSPLPDSPIFNPEFRQIIEDNFGSYPLPNSFQYLWANTCQKEIGPYQVSQKIDLVVQPEQLGFNYLYYLNPIEIRKRIQELRESSDKYGPKSIEIQKLKFLEDELKRISTKEKLEELERMEKKQIARKKRVGVKKKAEVKKPPRLGEAKRGVKTSDLFQKESIIPVLEEEVNPYFDDRKSYEQRKSNVKNQIFYDLRSPRKWGITHFEFMDMNTKILQDYHLSNENVINLISIVDFLNYAISKLGQTLFESKEQDAFIKGYLLRYWPDELGRKKRSSDYINELFKNPSQFTKIRSITKKWAISKTDIKTGQEKLTYEVINTKNIISIIDRENYIESQENIQVQPCSIVEVVINVNYDQDQNFVDTLKLYQLFPLSGEIPFVKLNDENVTDLIKFYSNDVPYDQLIAWPAEVLDKGLLYKVKIGENKYVTLIIYPNGRLDIKCVWDPEEHAQLSDVTRVLEIIRSNIQKINKLNYHIPATNRKKRIGKPDSYFLNNPKSNTKISFINTVMNFDLKSLINFDDMNKFASCFTPYNDVIRTDYKIEVKGEERKYEVVESKIPSRFLNLIYKRVSFYDTSNVWEESVFEFLTKFGFNTPASVVGEFLKEKFGKGLKDVKWTERAESYIRNIKRKTINPGIKIMIEKISYKDINDTSYQISVSRSSNLYELSQVHYYIIKMVDLFKEKDSDEIQSDPFYQPILDCKPELEEEFQKSRNIDYIFRTSAIQTAEEKKAQKGTSQQDITEEEELLKEDLRKDEYKLNIYKFLIGETFSEEEWEIINLWGAVFGIKQQGEHNSGLGTNFPVNLPA